MAGGVITLRQFAKDICFWIIWNCNFLWQGYDNNYGCYIKWSWVRRIFFWAEG